MDSHLVTVKVSVECLTHKWMQLDCLALDEDRFERLDTKSMQSWGTVQKHRVLLNYIAKDIPYLSTAALNHSLCRLDVLRNIEIDKTLHDERLEELQRHDLWKATLVQSERRTNNDDRTAGVVDTLSKQVLTEPTLFPLKHVRQRLERSVARSCDGTSTTTVVEERVNCLLQHSLLVVDNDLRRTKINQSLETVVAVDDSAIQIIHVGCCKTATVQLNHWPKIWRNHRHSLENHSCWIVLPVSKWLNNFEPLLCPLPALLTTRVDEILTELLDFGLEVHAADEILDELGTHATCVVLAIPVNNLSPQLF